MSIYAFLNPTISYPLPRNFDFSYYIDIEREFWALFPETEGKRVNFCQLGLTAQLYVEVPDDASELGSDETYILMPCPDRTLRPLRMKMHCRLTLSEYRMSHLTAIKLAGRLHATAGLIGDLQMQILGPEIWNELNLQ